MREHILKIKSGINNNSQIFKNMTWLTLLQLANYIIPLLLIPYVTRIVGVELFGQISYAQNIIMYLVVLVNFGFEYSGTQAIAINRDNKEKIRQIFSTILRIKMLLLVLAFVMLLFLSFVFDKVAEDKRLYFYAYLILLGHALFPNWLFQGLEKMAKMTIFNFVVKLSGAVLTVLFVRQENDYRLFVLFLSLSFIVVGLLSLFYVSKEFGVSYTNSMDRQIFRKGLPIFFNNLFSTVYSAVGLTLLGLMVMDYELGIYSGAYKIISACLMVITAPVTMALFPAISRKFALSFQEGSRFYKKAFLGSIFFGLLVSLFVFFASKYIVIVLLGNEFADAIEVLKVLSLIPLLVIIASMLTVQGLYALQLQKYSPYIGAAICLISLLVNYCFIKRMGIVGAAWSYVVVEVLEIVLVGMVLGLYFKLRK